jgi:hypothetical protein
VATWLAIEGTHPRVESSKRCKLNPHESAGQILSSIHTILVFASDDRFQNGPGPRKYYARRGGEEYYSLVLVDHFPTT